MIPKATKSFPTPSQMPGNIPASNLSDSKPYADYTENGTIVVISQPSGQSCAVVGGIMAARMQHLGAEGIVVDGRVRDISALNQTKLPIWSKATSVIGAGAETKFHAHNVPVKIGETIVEAGDIIMIDPFENGVVAVPQAKVDELLELLPKLVEADEKVTADVGNGVSVEEAFKRHRAFTMGITDFFSDVWETFSHPSADAEHPVQGGTSTKSPASGTDEESGDEAEVNKQDAKSGGSDEQGHKPSEESEEDEDEEEEEEPDPKDTLEKECAESKECHGPKHHYDECAQRVTGQIEEKGKADEDCVEEFFHLAHCATQCAAPKLFAQLK
ncbi:hypothetical protein COCSADRAFT_167424 [Bipolaris sorokiniana ND90Pr]|nr:uncharacterized protein COCSADRAFT_167424 [Bipolaris sorokiniana ND90Pr]EMD68163.1 hypothetical protein COCSADRAFT_167424 [Bipolaris sorokiniana ND90Pr]